MRVDRRAFLQFLAAASSVQVIPGPRHGLAPPTLPPMLTNGTYFLGYKQRASQIAKLYGRVWP